MASTIQNGVSRRPVYEVFTIGDENKEKKTEDPFIRRPLTSSSSVSAPAVPTSTSWNESSLGKASESLARTSPAPFSNTYSKSIDSSCSHDSMIFSPPNCVDDSAEQRPTTSWGEGGEPVKVPGDVSLTGKQLMPFLIKAACRLPTVKAQGVQLRLRQLNQMIEDNLFTEGYIKKLNYIVDALDQAKYDKAWEHYVIARETFPLEMSSNWAHGLKLLIQELMPLQRKYPRIGSAGSHVRNQ